MAKCLKFRTQVHIQCFDEVSIPFWPAGTTGIIIEKLFRESKLVAHQEQTPLFIATYI